MKRTIWRTIPNTNGFVQLSIEGRVRKVKHRTAFYGEDLLSGQIYEEVLPSSEELIKGINFKLPKLGFRQEGEKVSKFIAALMFETFHGIKNLQHTNILPANGNFSDLSLYNLLVCNKDEFYTYLRNFCLEQEQGCVKYEHSPKQYLARLSRAVSSYNRVGVLQGHYSSIQDFVRDKGINSYLVRKHLYSHKGQFLNDEHFLLNGHGPYDINLTLLKSSDRLYFNSTSLFNYQFVRCYNDKGILIKIYNNVREASVEAQVEFDEFYMKIKRTGSFIFDNKMWVVDRMRKS